MSQKNDIAPQQAGGGLTDEAVGEKPLWQSYMEHLVEKEMKVLKAALGGEDHAADFDDLSVDDFAAAMKVKLAKARDKGRGGWQQCSQSDLSRMLREHVEKGDPRDVANFCMFLWSMGKSILAAPRQPGEMGAGVPYKDSTPQLHVGDSAFESWYEQYAARLTGNPKQTARDAYAAGMGDPRVIAASAQEKVYYGGSKEPEPVSFEAAQQDEREAVEKWAAESPATGAERNAFIDGYRAAQQVQADAGAVAEVCDGAEGVLRVLEGFENLPTGAKLYTHPAGESDKRDADRWRMHIRMMRRRHGHGEVDATIAAVDAAISREQSQGGES